MVLRGCRIIPRYAALLILVLAWGLECSMQYRCRKRSTSYYLSRTQDLSWRIIQASAQYCSHYCWYCYPGNRVFCYSLSCLLTYRGHLMCVLILVIHSCHFVPELGLKGCYELLTCHLGLLCHYYTYSYTPYVLSAVFSLSRIA